MKMLRKNRKDLNVNLYCTEDQGHQNAIYIR